MTVPRPDPAGLVYPRDHTAYNSWPGTTHGASKLHWPNPSDRAQSACGRSVIDTSTGPSDMRGMGVQPETVPAVLRCRRPGCAQRWADVPAPVRR